MAETLYIRVKHKRMTASQWASSQDVLLAGELGIESDTGQAKVGNGSSLYKDLPYIGKTVDLSGYAKKSDIPDTSSFITKIPAEYLTEDEAKNIYQPKGNYATKEELSDVSTGGSVDLSNYLTKNTADSTYQPKGNYLTVIPSEYVTEAELQQQLGDINTILAKVVGVV
ncbi:hyaluronate lyase N-terminal domain-containing protein [Ignavigranum ruoffiae]|uniref:Major tropism determinant N-terminal domain-containing protein n=1 Tax=Ignavigranum ruoffiae TaxID=89093 RepID=A0A1H9BT08_9LACT|nr:hypothetical protein [Ignavigranum ruoffiae]SEP91841.1 hypothetical protein SAMN04488558_10385 [Ignavigranum ruoffiae]